MIPLIDSVFLILVFFIYAFLSMTVHRGLPVHLPSATAAMIDKTDYCAITINDKNEYFLNKATVDLAGLHAGLIDLYANDPDLRVYINGDQDAHHGAVVDVLDIVRTVGIENVSIETNVKDVVNE